MQCVLGVGWDGMAWDGRISSDAQQISGGVAVEEERWIFQNYFSKRGGRCSTAVRCAGGGDSGPTRVQRAMRKH